MPLPELLFNIAQAYRLKGDAKRALEMYKRFIEVIPDGQIADQARTNIAALTKQISDAELEAVAIEAARQRYETEREDRAHRRRIDDVMLGVGGAMVWPEARSLARVMAKAPSGWSARDASFSVCSA